MKIYDGPTEHEAKEIAAKLDIAFEGRDLSNSRGVRISGNLRPISGSDVNTRPYQRTSASYFNEGRRVFAVCWHGYRDFMREVFKRYPEARITSGIGGRTIEYRGAEGFAENYIDSAFISIGAPINGGYPRMVDACSCPESGDPGYPLSVADITGTFRTGEDVISENEARDIAASWHGGQTSALYAFSSSGYIAEDLEAEVSSLARSVTERANRDELAKLAAFVESVQS